METRIFSISIWYLLCHWLCRTLFHIHCMSSYALRVLSCIHILAHERSHFSRYLFIVQCFKCSHFKGIRINTLYSTNTRYCPLRWFCSAVLCACNTYHRSANLCYLKEVRCYTILQILALWDMLRKESLKHSSNWNQDILDAFTPWFLSTS